MLLAPMVLLYGTNGTSINANGDSVAPMAITIAIVANGDNGDGKTKAKTMAKTKVKTMAKGKQSFQSPFRVIGSIGAN